MINKPDLMEYLFGEYSKEVDKQDSELTPEAVELFNSFLEFCRMQLRKNPAVSMVVLEQGLGIRLADTNEVALVKMPELPKPRNSVMPVTGASGLFAANSGISDVRSTPIFGKDQ